MKVLATIGVLFVTLCHHSAATTPRPFPCDGIVHALSDQETAMVQFGAKSEIEIALANGTLTAPHTDRLNRDFPRVVYVACDWWDSAYVNGGKDRDLGWTAGETDASGWWIKVKTNEPQRTAPLVRWETINAYLVAIGRSDLTDIWQGQKTMRAFDAAKAQPWLITPDWLRTILEITARENTITPEVVDKIEERREMLAARKSRRMDETRYTTKRDAVAVLEVSGPIVRYADFFSEVSGGTATSHLALDFQAAMDDPSVKAIILAIDSPGGEATGIHELANQIFAARGQGKPIVAYAEGYAASAAYWIASAADEIVVDKTAMLGSIGVVFAIPDPTKRTAKEIEIVSTQSPKKRLDVTTDAGRSEIQRLADELATVFVDTVARNRGVTADAVLSDFGQGGIRIGSDAISHNMADRLGSLESLITELSTGNYSPRVAASHLSMKENDMDPKATPANAGTEVLTQQLANLQKENAELKAKAELDEKIRKEAEMKAAKTEANAKVDGWEREGKISGNATAAVREIYVAAATGATISAEQVEKMVAALPKLDTSRLSQNSTKVPSPSGDSVTAEDFAKSATDSAASKKIAAAVAARRKENPKFTMGDLRREVTAAK